MTPTRETFGNISSAWQALFYVVAVVAMVVCAHGFWRRFKLWRLGQPGNEQAIFVANVREMLQQVKPGLRRVLVEGLGQRRVRGRGLPSWAHGLLFAGFMMLLLGTTLLEVDHLAAMVSEKLKFHHGAYYVAYEYTLDVFGLLFLVGSVLFFWRRVLKPASVGHRASDWYVLGMFLGIGVTGYVVEALRIAWQKPTGLAANCSPVGLWLSSAFAGLAEPQARAVHLGVWWLHALLVFGFIAAIPYTRLRHIVTGPLNLFFARPSLGLLQPVTMEEVEKTERVGVSDIRHFTRQQLLSLDACMECGRCEEACPAFATGKPLSPKKVVQDLKLVMNKLAGAKSGVRSPETKVEGLGTRDSGLGTVDSGLSTNVHEHISAETMWSCTACSACVYVCPVRVDPLTLLLDMRRNLASEGGLSGTAATALRRMQTSGNPWGMPATERADWIQALNPPASGDTKSS